MIGTDLCSLGMNDAGTCGKIDTRLTQRCSRRVPKEFYFGKWRTPAAIKAFDRRSRRRFICLDCQYDTLKDEYYMLQDEVWLNANPKSKGMLCIGCVEARIGRRLKPEDFKCVPLHSDGRRSLSDRLLSRLGP